MSDSIVEANFEELEKIANQFLAQSEQADQKYNAVRGAVEVFRSGAWQGSAANEFFNEVESVVFPMTEKAISNLNAADTLFKQIIKTLVDAAVQASSAFQLNQ